MRYASYEIINESSSWFRIEHYIPRHQTKLYLHQWRQSYDVGALLEFQAFADLVPVIF
jgi:hypothetical protein